MLYVFILAISITKDNNAHLVAVCMYLALVFAIKPLNVKQVLSLDNGVNYFRITHNLSAFVKET